METGKRNSVADKQRVAKCIVVGDLLSRNVGAEQEEMNVECFPWNNTEQLHRVMEGRDLESPDSVIIHVGTNDLKKNEKSGLCNGRGI